MVAFDQAFDLLHFGGVIQVGFGVPILEELHERFGVRNLHFLEVEDGLLGLVVHYVQKSLVGNPVEKHGLTDLVCSGRLVDQLFAMREGLLPLRLELASGHKFGIRADTHVFSVNGGVSFLLKLLVYFSHIPHKLLVFDVLPRDHLELGAHEVFLDRTVVVLERGEADS